MSDLKKFSIDDIENLDDENLEFALCRIGFIASGNNGQNCPISEEVLRRDAHTALGKPIVAQYDRYANDVTSHVSEEVIVGWIPVDSEITFEPTDDGRVMAYAKCVLSKIYAKNVYELFKNKNYRSVSSEFTCFQASVDQYGDGEINEFNITGITILGTQYGLPVRPAVEGANIQVMKFSLDDANECFDRYNNPLKSFADDRRKKLEQKGTKDFPVNTSKEAVDMGDWNGDKTKHDLMDSKNYDSIGNKVCLDFTKGERKLENCKYPVMNIKGKQWVYNAEGLSSAMAYAAQHDPEVYKKAVVIQKKLGLYKDDKKEESMEENKKKDAPVEEEKDKDKVEDKKMSDTEKTPDAPKTDEKEAPKEETKKEEMSDDGKEDAVIMQDDKKDEKDKEDKKEEKKFSLDAYLDFDATLAMLANETENTKNFVTDFCKNMSAEDIVTCAVDLKKFKDAQLFADKQIKVDSVMASVKSDISEKDFADLQKEGRECSLENIGAFEDKVMAFAYKVSKKSKPNDGYMAFANDVRTKDTNETVDDLYNKYK